MGDILKDLKRKFRKISRYNISKLAMKDTNLINSEFKSKNLNVIWNKLKLHKKSKVNSTLNAYDFENHFNLLMKDEIPLNPDQLQIKTEVQERSLLLSRKYHSPSQCTRHVNITNGDVISFIKKLKKGTSPGADGITPEHMIYAASPELANILADTYNNNDNNHNHNHNHNHNNHNNNNNNNNSNNNNNNNNNRYNKNNNNHYNNNK